MSGVYFCGKVLGGKNPDLLRSELSAFEMHEGWGNTKGNGSTVKSLNRCRVRALMVQLTPHKGGSQRC
jgi:hypothetical protein